MKNLLVILTLLTLFSAPTYAFTNWTINVNGVAVQLDSDFSEVAAVADGIEAWFVITNSSSKCESGDIKIVQVNGQPVKFVITSLVNGNCQFTALSLAGQSYIITAFTQSTEVVFGGYRFSAIGFTKAMKTLQRNTETAI